MSEPLVCKHCRMTQVNPMVPITCESSEDGKHSFVSSEDVYPWRGCNDQLKVEEPTDEDMKNLFRDSDLIEIENLKNASKKERMEKFSDMLTNMMAEIAGKTGEDREIFREGYKKMISSVMESMGAGGSGPVHFQAPMPMPTSPPPCMVHTYEQNGVLKVIDFGSLLADTCEVSINLSNFNMEIGDEIFELDETRALLLILHRLRKWQTENPQFGIPARIDLRALSSLIDHPKIQEFLKDDLAAEN